MHCNNYRSACLSRRDMLRSASVGFGAFAAQSLLGTKSFGAIPNPLGPKLPHFPASAKSVIFLYMDGGPSQVDTFDYKPALEKYNGQNPREVMGKLERTQFDNIGKVLQSPWTFKQRGVSGQWVSDLFPEVGSCMDDICVIKSMVAKFPEHTFANYFLHTGSGLQGRPSMGAWVGYGLGSEADNLPGYIVLNGGLTPPGGLDNFNSGFLPAAYQGSVFHHGPAPVSNISPLEADEAHQNSKLSLVDRLDKLAEEHIGRYADMESRIANYETAFKMQAAVPELMSLDQETDATKRLYGLEHKNKNTKTFGRQCLIARRLVERGVRFVELTCPSGSGDRWDQHSDLRDGHSKNSLAVDTGIAGLIKDLKSRGLLDSTLIVWGGEFGRTPFAQGRNGRDHNPFGYTMWMAGGGVKGGMSYGNTDAWGYKAIEDKVEMHDMHATMLHLLGLNHERSTFRWSGRDMRLTDVHGHVLHDIIA